jgi:hypothetical protein
MCISFFILHFSQQYWFISSIYILVHVLVHCILESTMHIFRPCPGFSYPKNILIQDGSVYFRVGLVYITKFQNSDPIDQIVLYGPRLLWIHVFSDTLSLLNPSLSFDHNCANSYRSHFSWNMTHEVKT